MTDTPGATVSECRSSLEQAIHNCDDRCAGKNLTNVSSARLEATRARGYI